MHSALSYVPCPHPPHKSLQAHTTELLTQVLVNGQSAKALMDTGSTQTQVHDTLVPEDEYMTQNFSKVCRVHGEIREYLTAEVYLTVQEQTFLLQVTVLSHLPQEVVLGQDFPILCDLVSQVQSCNAVTRAQSARADFSELPFADADVVLACEKRHKSKKKRGKLKFWGSVESRQVEQLPLPEGPLKVIIPEDIVELQKKDFTLQHWFQKVSEVDGVRNDIVSHIYYHRQLLTPLSVAWEWM